MISSGPPQCKVPHPIAAALLCQDCVSRQTETLKAPFAAKLSRLRPDHFCARPSEELRSLGYAGSYDAVRRDAKGVARQERRRNSGSLSTAQLLRRARPTSSTGRTRSC
jgi:hypothetical protein